jgi:hypothetical protein
MATPGADPLDFARERLRSSRPRPDEGQEPRNALDFARERLRSSQATQPSVERRAPVRLPSEQETAVGRVLDAFARGVAEPFEDDPDLGLDEETKRTLRNVGLLNDPAKPASPFKTFNDMVIVGGAAGVDLLLKSADGLIRGASKGITQTGRELGMGDAEANRLERDLNALALTSVIAASPGAVTRAPRLSAQQRLEMQQRARQQTLAGSGKIRNPVQAQQLASQAAQTVTQATDEALLASARGKIGQRSIGEATKEARFGFGNRLLTNTLDALRPIKVLGEKGPVALKAEAEKLAREAAGNAERLANVAARSGKPADRAAATKAANRAADLTFKTEKLDTSPDLRPYNEMRLLAGIRGTLDHLFSRGTFRWNARGDLEPDGGPSVKRIFEGVSDLDDASMYFAGRRAKELKGRKIEVPFSDDEIGAMLRIGDRSPEVKDAFRTYQDFNKRILDFAEQSGLIDAATKQRFLDAGRDYVPFYRLVTDEFGELKRTTKGGLFKRIKGGTAPLQEIVDNVARNAAAWTELGVRNQAKSSVYDMIERFGFDDVVERIPQTPQMARLADDRIRNFLEAEGVTKPDQMVAVWTAAGRRELGENVDVIFRNGKREFWKIKGPEFFKAINTVNPKSFGLALRVLSGFSNVLRRGVTLAPDFMARNLVRDLQSGFVQSGANFVPVIDNIRGITSRLVKDDDYWNLILNGGGFATTYAGETGAGRNLRRFYGRRGINYGLVLDTPRKLADGVEALSNAFEMSTRLGEFKKAVGKGRSVREAALLAREVSTDFGLRGASPAIQALAASVPFLNARAQGLSKLARTAKSNPARVALKGLLPTGLGAMALWSINRDNPDYQALPDWVKDQHWTVPIPGSRDFYLIPMGFEYGSLFGTVPMRMMEAIEEQHGKRFAQAIGRMAFDTLSFNPVPQAFKPIADIAMNRKFTGAPIVSQDLEAVRASEQFRPWTSDTLVELAQILREDAGIEMSPVQVEHLVRGYFGTLGAYALGASDMIVRAAGGREAPEMRLDEMAVAGSFFRETPFRGTQFETDFYELLGQARMASATFNKMLKEGRTPDLTEREAKLNALRGEIDKIARVASQINQGMRLAQTNRDLSSGQKRAELDRLQASRNDMFEQFMRGVGRSPSVSEIPRSLGLTPVPPRRPEISRSETSRAR